MTPETRESLENWLSYSEHHPDHPHTAEWAADLLRKIATETGVE